MKKEITKHPGGRPTKYIPEVINSKVEKYLSMVSKEQAELPTVEGLALELGVSRETMYAWANEYPEFSDTIKKVLEKQKVRLMSDGFYGGKEVNANMAIFLLKVNHGMKDDSPKVLQQFNVGGDKSENKIVFVNFKNGTES